MNIFEKVYGQVQEVKAQYDSAENTGNKEGMKAAQSRYQEIMNEFAEETSSNENLSLLYNLYETSRDCGNAYIDLRDVNDDRKVPGIVEAMRENGITKFTFSSTWSSAVEIGWLFVENGCKLEGMVEINTPHKVFMTDEYEKGHAYLFSL